jgi:hypothetical protein
MNVVNKTQFSKKQGEQLRKITGPKIDLIREWRKLHNEELHDLYSAPNIIGVIKPRTMR